MTADFTPSQPEKEEVELVVSDAGVTVRNFTEYSFNANYLTPSDGWSFTVGTGQLSNEMRGALMLGAPVKLVLDGLVQSSGYIDSIEVTASRTSGVEYHIVGRDRLGQAVSASADPTKQFKEGQTILDAMQQLLGPFGWPEEDDYIADNDADRDLKSGGVRGVKQKSKAKGHSKRKVARHKLHQLTPHMREGVYAFADRIANRFGLHITSSADGETLIIARPNFDQEPIYKLRRAANPDATLGEGAITNVLSGSVKYDLSKQPTIIVADGVSGGGEFGRSPIKIIMVNTTVHTTDPAFIATFEKHRDAKQILGHAFATPVKVPKNVVLYLHDEESQTIEHLENYVRREMALLQKDGLVVSYTVEGHGQNTPDGFRPWTVDTTVDVDDEVAGLRERFWVIGRTFNKSRNGGTTTHLELIRLHSIALGEPPKPAKPAAEYKPRTREHPFIEYQSAK